MQVFPAAERPFNNPEFANQFFAAPTFHDPLDEGTEDNTHRQIKAINIHEGMPGQSRSSPCSVSAAPRRGNYIFVIQQFSANGKRPYTEGHHCITSNPN